MGSPDLHHAVDVDGYLLRPASPMTHLHARTIAVCTARQRLLGLDPLWTNRVKLSIKKLMTRIRITEEAMQDSGKGAFIDAMKMEAGRQWLHYDATTHSWVKP